MSIPTWTIETERKWRAYWVAPSYLYPPDVIRDIERGADNATNADLEKWRRLGRHRS